MYLLCIVVHCAPVLSCSRPSIRRIGGGMHLLIDGYKYINCYLLFSYVRMHMYVFLFAYKGFRCSILYESTQYSISQYDCLVKRQSY